VLRLTVALKPFVPVMVIVKVAKAPLAIVRLVGAAVMVKSGATAVTVTGTVTKWDSAPLSPVTLTKNVPVELVLTVRVALPEPVMFVGFTTALIPKELATLSATVPENPLIEPTVIVDEPVEPTTSARLIGLAEMEKSAEEALTMIVMFTPCPSEPLLPETKSW
jgi:hypothetical protein